MKPVPYYVLALAMAIPAVLVGVEIPSWLHLGSETYALQSDLRVFYTPGYMLRTGQAKDIYDFSAIRRNQEEKIAPDNGAVPFLHPAYEAIFFIPLSLLPYRAAYIVRHAVGVRGALVCSGQVLPGSAIYIVLFRYASGRTVEATER